MKAFLVIMGVSLIGTIVAVFHTKQQPGMPDISKGKCVVQLNYNWNKNNDYIWKSVPGIKYYYLSLDNFPELKTRMNIKTVPTIILLQDGKEVKRCEGGLMMKISQNQSEICQ